MKRTLLFLLLIIYLLPSITLARDFNGFFVLDQITNTVEIYAGPERIKSFKAGPKPERVIANQDNGGYILMHRGAKKKPGGLTILDQAFNTLTRKELPGIVVQDFYLKETGLWLLFTVSSDKDSPDSNLTYYDLKTGATDTIRLNGQPVVYRFNEDQTELAIGTLGNSKNKVPAELVLIDLTQKQVRSFPVSANPGAIFKTASGKIMVACGGFRNSQRYPSKMPLEQTATAELAKLHWIDTLSGATELLQLEYSPLLISQDQYDLDTFYAVSSNVYGDPNEEKLGIVLGSDYSVTDKPEATFYIITSGKIVATLDLQKQPHRLIQTSPDRICLQGGKELLIIDVSGPTPKRLAYQHDRSIDEFLINNDGTIAYLSNSNSNYLNIIDLKAGKEIKTLKISDSFYIGKLFFNFLGSGFPPVIGSSSVQPFKRTNPSENRRMFFTKDYTHLYVLAGAPEVAVIDLQTNEVKSLIKFKDTQYGIHPCPDGKYIVVAAENGWHLLDPATAQTIFSLNFRLEEDEQGPEKGYYSPNGELLIVPFKNYLYLIDPIRGSSLGKTRTKALNPLIVWPE